MKSNMSKRVSVILLSMLVMISMMPFGAFAETEAGSAPDETQLADAGGSADVQTDGADTYDAEVSADEVTDADAAQSVTDDAAPEESDAVQNVTETAEDNEPAQIQEDAAETTADDLDAYEPENEQAAEEPEELILVA